MEILTRRSLYGSSKGANSTDYFRKQHLQRGRCLPLLRDSFKDILQELLEAEMDASLGYSKNHKAGLDTDNKRNGYSQKTIKASLESSRLISQGPQREFEPKLVPKHQRDVSGIEEKVIALYARGMSTRDIHDQIQDLYGIEMSAEMVSKITDRILPEVKEWQSRPRIPCTRLCSWMRSTIRCAMRDALSAKPRISSSGYNRGL